MKKTKILSLLLCLSLLCALLVPGPAAHADAADSGMNISKTATRNDDGSYTITLEAFATGSKVTQVVKEDVPTDIILVLDQSGSMADDIGTVAFEKYKDEDDGWYETDYHTRNRDYFNYRHNGGSANLWHKLEDGSYVSVSVTKTQEYKQLSKDLPNCSGLYECYWDYANNLYEKVGDEYKRVRLDWSDLSTFTYTFSDGTSVSSQGLWSTPNLGTHAPLYTPVADGTSTVYTYTYTDTSGVTQTIGTSTGADTKFTPAFYQRSTTTTGGDSRLNALKSAANAFASAVATKAAGADGDINTTADNINHRIAVVGYADTDSDYGYNTGVFIGSTLNRYEDSAAGVYSTALQDMSTTNGKNNVAASLNALRAGGATRTDYGLTMANGILNANPVPAGETRNRVVIVFTDGSPTDSNGFERYVANAAINNANAIKDSGATMYSIGIFSGADASTAGEEPDEDYYDGIFEPNYTDAEMSAACNWFMQNVSSNNGTPRSPSYYLSASDAGSLNNIFQQISSNIESGGSSTTLDEKSEIRDIIAPAFSVPANASDVKLYTSESVGSTTNWKECEPFDGTVKIENSTVTASGFSFKDNWCGNETNNGTTTFHDGKKLIIEFTVAPKPGFLGGNDVHTNGKAGVYENAQATTPLMEFENPTVNIPIPEVSSVTALDKNVYLLGSVTADDLKSGATVTVGGNITLDLSKANDTEKPYGLEPWQTEYVNITVTVKGEDGNAISTPLSSLTEDTTYTIEVTVSPKTDDSTTTPGTPAAAKTGTANINVFKPTLTFKDSDVYYGDAAPADYNGSLTTTQWKHGDTLDSSVTMIGTAPNLGLTYTPEAGKIANGKINTKQDIAVDVAVKIGTTDVTGSTTFIHTMCSGNSSCTDPANGKFWLHVKTCTLNITKACGATDESYVFTVMKDGVPYSEVSIEGNDSQTIYELPVGAYTITENTGWSWRYTANYSGGATLSATTPEGTITCTNTQNKDQWLNGFSAIVRNIFGQNH